MKAKYREIPVYEEVELVGKTVDSTTGTIDRKSIGRVLLTEAAGFEDGKHEVVDGDGTVIRTAAKINEDTGIELRVELVGGIKSLATYKVYKGWTAANKENPEVVDLFTKDEDNKLLSIVNTAKRMSEAHPECDGQWMIVDVATGKRVFFRLVKDVDAKGKIKVD